MTRKSHHVVLNPEGGWNVKKGGADRASKTFAKKDRAIGFARKISKNQHTELVVHRKDGTIQFADSHGKDPNPPRDKR